MRLLIVLAAVLACVCVRAEEFKDVVYGQGYVAGEKPGAFVAKDLTLDAYLPKGDGPFPALVMAHGGSFQGGSKEARQLRALAKDLADEGFACFSINYRKVGDNPPAPTGWDATILQQAMHACFTDMRTAIRHVRANAAKYKVDPARIAVLGESAGAFAAIAAGVADAGDFLNDRPDLPPLAMNNLAVESRVAAVVDLWGNAEMVMKKFSPGDAPMLIIHGKADYHIGTFYAAALNIAAACKANGIPHELHGIEGAGHGCWDAEIEGKPLAEVVAAWLKRTL